MHTDVNGFFRDVISEKFLLGVGEHPTFPAIRPAEVVNSDSLKRILLHIKNVELT